MDLLTQLRAERGKVTRPFKCRAPRFSPERLGPRLWKSHVESHLGGRSFPPTIDSVQHIDHDSSMRTSHLCGMRERPINNLRSSLRRPGPAPSCSRPPQDQTNPRCELFPPPLSPT